MAWKSDHILAEPGLRLTSEEKADILSRMPPPASIDGQIYVNGGNLILVMKRKTFSTA